MNPDPRTEPHLAQQGIVTACDSAYFPGLLMMHASVQQSMPIPVVAYDLGLSAEQLTQAEQIANLHVLPLPDDDLIGSIQRATRLDPPMLKPGKRLWPLWICPVLIQHAPFRDVYWLDCDLLVLRGLEAMFQALESGPVFTPENRAPGLTANKPGLYLLEPITGLRDPALPTINAGVSGWRKSRDASVLAAYRYLVERAAADERVRAEISWHDQGCLMWAIQRTGLQHRVQATNDWNLCVVHTPLVGTSSRSGSELLEYARQVVPDAAVVHWNGSEPPWSYVTDGWGAAGGGP